MMFVFGVAMHEPLWPDQPPGHGAADCTRCHPLVADAGANSFAPVNYSRECRTCHTDRPIGQTSTARSFHQTDRACTDCHTFHETNLIHISGSSVSFDISEPARTDQCLACHTESGDLGDLSPGHQAAATYYHSDLAADLSASQSCLACHGETATGSTSSLAVDAPTFAEHGSHPIDIEVVPGSGRPGNRIRNTIDPRLQLSDSRLTCLTCHRLTAGTNARLVIAESQTALCRGCHEPD